MTYYEWLVYLLCDNSHPHALYSRVLHHLMDTQFYWVNPYDKNRGEDGIYMRVEYERAAENEGDEAIIDAPPWPTMLEVMAALAVRCEQSIMYDPDEGDRTTLWFWMMMRNLGIEVTNSRYDPEETECILQRLLAVEYEPNGVGGLFPVQNSRYDLREMDIWRQMGFYLNLMFPT